ncbi:uncharacterized protein LOC116952106 [Petromyzon marinus]|uniref:WAP four-disulfide core domain protein 5-like n=2 Tax=Petromyzon marinus TaxID=7757 RepID=A0AAJ7TZN4_PETMA|nr:WAP four-disulfide core domain protein 5-like [Petromyzon marinus]
MEIRLAVCAVLLLAVGYVKAFGYVSGPDGYKSCPKKLLEKPFQRGCANDQDCPSSLHKCCVFDCGPVCVTPVVVKFGVCPVRHGMGMCAEYCTDDVECPGDEKCCSNGCGHECMKAHSVKPGKCPQPKTTGMCAEYCEHDGDCSDDQKCCQTTCGHACSDPCE